MLNYIRAKFEGGYYFFTVVTYERTKLFRTELARRCLREAIERVQSRRPFETVAFCLLFDHLISNKPETLAPNNSANRNGGASPTLPGSIQARNE
jgi:putative transposase